MRLPSHATTAKPRASGRRLQDPPVVDLTDGWHHQEGATLWALRGFETRLPLPDPLSGSTVSLGGQEGATAPYAAMTSETEPLGRGGEPGESQVTWASARHTGVARFLWKAR
jgi:hypothetical protein